MENFTITENYSLFLLKERGKFNNYDTNPYLITTMITEMMLDQNLDIVDKNKVVLKDKEPVEKYNKHLYNYIKDTKKEKISLSDIITGVCRSFSDKVLKSIIGSLSEKMTGDNLITTETQKGFFGNKEVVKVNVEVFTKVSDQIKNDFLKEGVLDDDIILTASLLNASRFFKNLFSKYEKEALKNKLDEIKDSDIAEKVKAAQTVIALMDSTDWIFAFV